MPESAFLDAVVAFLADRSDLVPAPRTLGIAEPAAASDLPGITLALQRIQHLSPGVGERAEVVTEGVLVWSARIDLANPFLPEEPDFPLVSEDRLQLILPHGGLVRADGTRGSLGPADLQVTVSGAPRTVVDVPPGANEVRAEPEIGRLTFGAPLPAAGPVAATYRLGQWERTVVGLAGWLTLEVSALLADDVASLSHTALRALQEAARGAIAGLDRMRLVDLSAIERPQADRNNARLRRAVLAFEYEHRVDAPESSGGVIARIPITTWLEVAELDAATGEITVVTESEQDEVRRL